MRGAAALGVLAAGLAGAPAVPAASPPCEVRRVLEPPRAFVGELVRHRVVVLQREDVDGIAWETAPGFPGFRRERLSPGHTEPGFVRDGRAWLRREAWSALFPARAGAWTLPPARLRCGAAGPVPLPATRFEARPPPDAGRPPEWAGLVGPVSLAVEAEPRGIRLGEAVRVTVTLQGVGNVWDARPVLEAPEGVEVFARPSRVELRRGDTLGVVRSQRFDWVPRRAGALRAAPARVSWLDPDTGRYATARAAVPRIAVEPAPAGAADRADAASAGAEAPDAAAVRGTGWPVRAAWLLAGAALCVALWLARRAGRRAGAADPVAAARAEARRARRRGAPGREAAALESGLRAALEAAAGRTPHAALEPSPDDARQACASALRDLERARFAGDGGAPDLAAARAALERAGRR